ncbi:agamous-like MADS-box protein AGL62 [Bidens hawaiensis]|uniref:agamous-like MADS-box protein AGL62 n=1 Tax=Bidens hawaiensis TaxID=980011 RepID=UPI0040492CBC
MPRKSEGRKNIEIVKITNESSSSVAFTKRRSGVFKKAMYSFGKPDVEEIINRFLNPIATASSTSHYVQHLRDANIKELNTQLTNVDSEVESAKKANEELQKMRKAHQEQNWWDRPVDNIGYADLAQLKMALLQLGEAAEKHIE